MRLFVALEIPAGVRESLADLIKELRAADEKSSKSNARWVRAENLHVTLKFIGHVDEQKCGEIRAALARIHSDSAVELCFRGLGFFPGEKRARVLWAGMEASANLVPLARETDEELGRLGIGRETREFAPHLTLARLDPPGINEKLRAAVATNSQREFGSVWTGEFHLFESKTRPAGAEYTRLASFPFVKAQN